eukprot:1159480-Pelagomonas_calceolata.AAC.8
MRGSACSKHGLNPICILQSAIQHVSQGKSIISAAASKPNLKKKVRWKTKIKTGSHQRPPGWGFGSDVLR